MFTAQAWSFIIFCGNPHRLAATCSASSWLLPPQQTSTHDDVAAAANIPSSAQTTPPFVTRTPPLCVRKKPSPRVVASDVPSPPQVSRLTPFLVRSWPVRRQFFFPLPVCTPSCDSLPSPRFELYATFGGSLGTVFFSVVPFPRAFFLVLRCNFHPRPALEKIPGKRYVATLSCSSSKHDLLYL